ncbi:MAG: hypothetical protein RRA94_12850 [Bacteroidota bacterium]|nr:hypothetical protein [Bacteroidota bacterium]
MKTVRTAVLFTLLALLYVTAADAQGTDAKTQDKAAAGAVGPVKFSGLMFGDIYYYMDAMDEADKDMNGVQFRRIYFTTDYAINATFSTRFRLEADQSAKASNGKISVFVKDAFLKWKGVFAGSDLVLGMSPTPAFNVSEDAWGYRALEKTIMDLNGIVSSRDLGIDLKGKVDESGMVRYWLKLGNNSGNTPETDKYKRYYGMLQFKPTDAFQFTLYADYASNPQVSDSVSGTMKDNGALVTAGFVNYQVENSFSIGVEGFYKSHANNYYATAGDELSAQAGFGISAFAWVALSDEIRLVGRYDSYDPNSDGERGDDVRSLLIAALDYRVASNVSFMPGVEMLSREGMDDSDVIPRVTFLWNF